MRLQRGMLCVFSTHEHIRYTASHMNIHLNFMNICKATIVIQVKVFRLIAHIHLNMYCKIIDTIIKLYAIRAMSQMFYKFSQNLGIFLIIRIDSDNTINVMFYVNKYKH